MATLPTPRERPTGRTRSPTVSEGPHKSPLLFAGSLVARSFVLAALAATALLVALAAWFGLKSALRVDPVIGRERVWLQYGCVLLFSTSPHFLSSCSSKFFPIDRHFRPPYAVVRLEDGKYSVPGRVYDVSVEASVPVNENNLELGALICVPAAAGRRTIHASSLME